MFTLCVSFYVYIGFVCHLKVLRISDPTVCLFVSCMSDLCVIFTESTTEIAQTTTNTTGSIRTTTNTTGSTQPTTNSTGSAPSSSVTPVILSTVTNDNTSTEVSNSTQPTTKDFTPQISILPANETSTPKTTRSPPRSTPKPGFDGASFGGGIALGVGIVLLFVFVGVGIMSTRNKFKGPSYEVL